MSRIRASSVMPEAAVNLKQARVETTSPPVDAASFPRRCRGVGSKPRGDLHKRGPGKPWAAQGKRSSPTDQARPRAGLHPDDVPAPVRDQRRREIPGQPQGSRDPVRGRKAAGRRVCPRPGGTPTTYLHRSPSVAGPVIAVRCSGHPARPARSSWPSPRHVTPGDVRTGRKHAQPPRSGRPPLAADPIADPPGTARVRR